MARTSGSCECNNPILGAEGYCQRCGQLIDSEKIEKLQSEIDSDFQSNTASATPTPEFNHPTTTSKKPAPAKNFNFTVKISSKDAARRTLKYATLFEDIGRWTQYLNAAGAIILMIALIIMDLDSLTRITYWVLVLFVWWISYIQTSLMRGLASYFQMKAAAHLENS